MFELREGKCGGQLTIYNRLEKEALIKALFDPENKSFRQQFEKGAKVELERDRASNIAVFADTLDDVKSAKTELEKMAKELHRAERKAATEAERARLGRLGLEKLGN
jgi:hypothetical protein